MDREKHTNYIQCTNLFTDLTPCFLLGLADPVHSADGLELVSRVEDRLHQQHVSRFDDVQTVGPGVERKEEDVDLLFVFEGTQVLLGNSSRCSSYNHTKLKNIYIFGSCSIGLSTTCVGLLLSFITAIQNVAIQTWNL